MAGGVEGGLVLGFDLCWCQTVFEVGILDAMELVDAVARDSFDGAYRGVVYDYGGHLQICGRVRESIGFREPRYNAVAHAIEHYIKTAVVEVGHTPCRGERRKPHISCSVISLPSLVQHKNR
jgi:hypothetical protein